MYGVSGKCLWASVMVLIALYLRREAWFSQIRSQLCEKRLITKEHIAVLKRYSITLVFFGCNWQYITRITPINNIDGNRHKTELKSCRNQSFKVKILPPVIYGLAWGCTHTHTYIHACMKVVSRNQVQAGLWLACAWFKDRAM